MAKMLVLFVATLFAFQVSASSLAYDNLPVEIDPSAIPALRQEVNSCVGKLDGMYPNELFPGQCTDNFIICMNEMLLQTEKCQIVGQVFDSTQQTCVDPRNTKSPECVSFTFPVPLCTEDKTPSLQPAGRCQDTFFFCGLTAGVLAESVKCRNPDFVFNLDTNTCTDPAESPSCQIGMSTTTPSTLPTTTPLTVPPTTTSTSAETTPSTTATSSTVPDSTTTPRPFACPARAGYFSLLPGISCCTNYFSCSAGAFRRKRCPTTYVFDSRRKTCVSIRSTKCPAVNNNC